MIEKNFEKSFYISTNKENDLKHEIYTDFAKIRGIYKDTFGNENPEEEYLLSSNGIIASFF